MKVKLRRGSLLTVLSREVSISNKHLLVSKKMHETFTWIGRRR